MADLPLRDGADALRATWLEVEVSKHNGKVTCRNGFVTDLDVTYANVAEIAACGCARWKIGNGTFNVPETNMCTINALVVLPSWTGPVATPVIDVPPPDAA